MLAFAKLADIPTFAPQLDYLDTVKSPRISGWARFSRKRFAVSGSGSFDFEVGQGHEDDAGRVEVEAGDHRHVVGPLFDHIHEAVVTSCNF